MATPATTGQLKTKLEDMNIGDYISCDFDYTRTWDKMFYNLGKAALSELNYTGSLNSGSFYFVKVDKGLLIADRTLKSSITWDIINSNKYIQSFSWNNTDDLVPTMSSNTLGSIVVSASSEESASYAAWRAFDRLNSADKTRWITNGTTTGWYKIDFGVNNEKAIIQYTLRADTFPTGAPKNWTFEASTTGSFAGEQVVLDTRSGVIFPTSGKIIFNTTNTTKYRYYRFNITANGGYASYLEIDEIEFGDIVGKIRSLTGGVSYADANGNSSTTSLNFGAWPTNNEWDKYITNFPTGRIQSGKTLDDVFHTSNLASWTQETPIPAIGANTLRVRRGGSTGVNTFSPIVSSTSSTAQGFRPVFEYTGV